MVFLDSNPNLIERIESSERLSGIELIPCLVSRDNFEEFIKEIKCPSKEGFEKVCQKL